MSPAALAITLVLPNWGGHFAPACQAPSALDKGVTFGHSGFVKKSSSICPGGRSWIRKNQLIHCPAGRSHSWFLSQTPCTYGGIGTRI